MGDTVEVRVPDIGDFEDVEVVELLVRVGDRVEAEDPLVSIESDKATMEIPSPAAGVVKALHVALGAKVSEGTLLLELSSAVEAGEPTAKPASAPAAPERAPASKPASAAKPTTPKPAPAAPAGAAVSASAVTESASVADESASAVAESASPAVVPAATAAPAARVSESSRPPGEGVTRPPPLQESTPPSESAPHASPLVRRQARELGVDLRLAPGSGPHGRVLDEDVKQFVRSTLAGGSPADSSADAAPTMDAARFGPVHEVALGRIRRASARNLSHSWRTAPHVTQHDEADVSELEVFRKSVADEAKRRNVKLSPLHFVMKATAIALREFPDLRASLAPGGERLVVKDYLHLGIAVDTENGLVVPVVRDVDRKGLLTLAEELAGLAEKARAKKLAPADMQGAVFTISSLGGIGGTAFTPIVNVPEVAILGLSKLLVRPVWNAGLDVAAEDGRFEPRIVLPLSLSYDHRVVDGAVAVRFTTRLVQLLSHPAHLLL